MTPDDLQSMLSDMSELPQTVAQQSLDHFVSCLQPAPSIFEPYKNDPVGYARDVLGIKTLWSAQEEVLRLCAQPKSADWSGKLALGAGIGTGKTFVIGGVLVNWFFDCFESITATTAPSQTSVVDLLWKEVRIQRGNADPKWGIGPKDFIGPQAPEMRRSPAWWAKGYVAAKGENFKGRHVENMLFVFEEACHDDQTDVMTEFGWKMFSDLDGTERLLTMDPETHVAEYALPLKIVKKRHLGKMMEYRCSRGANWCVTPDHQMYWSKSNGDGTEWQRSSMAELQNGPPAAYMMRTIRQNNPDREVFVLPALKTDRKHIAEKIVLMDDWVTFLGWYFSEGHLLHAKNKQIYGFAVTQNEGPELDEIVALFNRLDFDPKVYKSGVASAWSVHSHGMQVSRWLFQFGTGSLNKHLPPFLRDLSIRQINLFLDAYTKGDGYIRESRDIIYTISEKMADGLQELILRTGKDSSIRKQKMAGMSSDMGTHIATSTVDRYVISRSHEAFRTKYRKCNLEEIDYDGFVWCATLPKHNLLFTRRGGRVVWSGNCGLSPIYFRATKNMFKADAPHMLWVCIFNPTDTSSEMYQEIIRPDSDWHVMALSTLDHPNIVASMNGEPMPIPAGVSLAQLEDGIKEDCDEILESEKTATDFQWPRPRDCPCCRGTGWIE